MDSTERRLSAAQIDRLVKPRSVAVVGASDKPGALGAAVLANLDRNGFAGPIYPINPNRDRIGERTCLNSIDDLPEGVDAAVLAIPRAGVVDAMRSLAARKVGAVVIFSAGFAEDGEAGKREQAEIARIAADAGMVVEGPNCLGLVNYVEAIPLTFVETKVAASNTDARFAVVSQSGAMAAVLSTMLVSRDLVPSYSISTGNEAVSGVEDYIDWVSADAETTVVAMIVEHFRKPARFLAAARRARQAGKEIVLLHPGKSNAARKSAATHTGAIAGDYALMRRKVERAGVIFAETLEELCDITEILIRSPKWRTGDLAVLGESGAFKALTLDLTEELELDLVDFDDANSAELRAALPPFVPVSNPLDITAQGLSQPSIYTDTIKALLKDERVGAILAGIIHTDPSTANLKIPPILAGLDGKRPQKPLIYAGLDEGAPLPEGAVAELRANGLPYFPSTERALRAIARLSRAAKHDISETPVEPLALPALNGWAGVIPEYRAKDLLGPLGIPFPEGRFAASEDEAAAAANALGYPVAMKAQAAALGHKSDAGGVILNLADEGAIRAAWSRIHGNVSAYAPNITLDGVLIEKMGERGMEMIVGARNDPEWGPIVLAGFGGVTAEILKDVRLFVPGMSQAAIEDELGKLKSAALLHGYRGSPALDISALARLIQEVARLFDTEPSLQELDLNPVILYPAGRGLVALDALMLIEQT